jgi:hypothetical protein
MQLTKEILLADKSAFSESLAATNGVIKYIDGLVAFMDRENLSNDVEGELVESNQKIEKKIKK